MTGSTPGRLGEAPVRTIWFLASHSEQRAKWAPSRVSSNVSTLERLRHFLQMNCWAIGKVRRL